MGSGGMANRNVIVYSQNLQHKNLSSLGQKCIPLHDYSPDGVPSIFVVQQDQLQNTYTKLQRIQSAYRPESLVISIIPPSERRPEIRLSGVLAVKLSCPESLHHLVLIALGESPLYFDPGWYYGLATADAALLEIRQWVDALKIQNNRSATISPDYTVASLAAYFNYSSKTALRYCKKLFDTKPGELLALRRLFFHLAQCMRQEQMLTEKRRGFSPLPEVPEGFPQSFKRRLGLTYTAFRHLAEKEHWLAVLGRVLNEQEET